MFENFLKLFSKQNLLDQSYETTVTMLKSDLEMFRATMDVLRNEDTAELPFNIYQKDKEINRFEREVRKNVLTHLAISGVHNVGAGLALVSIVIDVERIGDYCKNIAELATAHAEKLKGGIFEADLKEIETKVLERFEKIIQAVEKPDVEIARDVMSDYRGLTRKSDGILMDIVAEKDKSLAVHDAVVLALYFRYLKRVASHLMNIASSVVNPFPRIGFRDKSLDKKEEPDNQ